jgi:hypothetical protein
LFFSIKSSSLLGRVERPKTQKVESEKTRQNYMLTVEFELVVGNKLELIMKEKEKRTRNYQSRKENNIKVPACSRINANFAIALSSLNSASASSNDLMKLVERINVCRLSP